jgi:hypothetical protein
MHNSQLEVPGVDADQKLESIPADSSSSLILLRA